MLTLHAQDDEAAFVYAYLKSPSKNEELRHSQVFEVYIKFKLYSHRTFCTYITLDYQYLRDTTRDFQNSIAGNIFGVRLTFNF